MAEEDGIPKSAGLSGIVPHFYYDLIGRIVPGTYLIAGIYWVTALNGRLSEFDITLSATAVLVLALSAYAVSFIIGPCSHWLFDRFRHFGEQAITEAVCTVLKQNHIQLPAADKSGKWHSSILERSERCLYTLWLRAPQLAIMCSRWDAEAFAARQFGTVTIVLVLIAGWMTMIGQPLDHPMLVFSLAAFVLVLSIFQFRYLRRKAVLSRFTMLACAPARKLEAQ